MTTWNYRIVEFAGRDDDSAWRELREVFYDEHGRPCAYGGVAQVAWSADEDPKTPNLLLERMKEALGKPILMAQDFESKDKAGSTLEPDTFTVTLEQVPDSEDIFLQLPEHLMTSMDWRVDDTLNFEVIGEGRCILSNLSKIARERQSSEQVNKEVS